MRHIKAGDGYRPEIVARIKDLLSRQSVEGEDREKPDERVVLDKIDEPETRANQMLFVRVCEVAESLGIDCLSEPEVAEIEIMFGIRKVIAQFIEAGEWVEVRDLNGAFVFRARLPSDRHKYEPPLIV